MSDGERTFVYGLRTARCQRAIAIFSGTFVIDGVVATIASSMFMRVALGLFMLWLVYMIWVSARALGRRRAGAMQVVVGATALRAPRSLQKGDAVVELPYTAIRGLTETPGENGALEIEHSGGKLKIGRAMLETDAEHAELRKLIEAHMGAAR